MAKSKAKKDEKDRDKPAKKPQKTTTRTLPSEDDSHRALLTPNPLSQFSFDDDALRLALITAQYALRATRQQQAEYNTTPHGLLVLVNGMEQAGKGAAVKQLREWVDPRLLKVEATIGTAPQPAQPIWQTHTHTLPRTGEVMVYFGNWYADLIYQVMRLISDSKDKDAKGDKGKNKSAKKHAKKAWRDYLQRALTQLSDFERDLAANQTKLLKCWFHIDADTLKDRLHDDDADPEFLYQIDWDDQAVIKAFNKVATLLIEQQGDWVIIDGTDKPRATNRFCHEVLHAIQHTLVDSKALPVNQDDTDNKKAEDKAAEDEEINSKDASEFVCAPIPEVLTDIGAPDMDKDDYHKALADKQSRLAALLRARGDRHVVFAFEGMDAAGKGGAIKRLVAPLDPREYQVYNIGAPMNYELEHPYLWRFWTRLPNTRTDRISRVAIFDRTWYGRVLVERVEGFAKDHEWQRAYGEINRFEAQLVASGTTVLKYWLAIDKKTQLERFEAREETPHKEYKLTDDDWRNRDKWDDYVQAAADMLARTNTDAAPWHIIATNDKRRARLQVLEHAINQLESAKGLR
ncbi:ATPase [Psychrobacter aestuarii]|uniref:Polyphosphate--AMP phosphotransferase n=1 Tax=Psychrobacter aestuarii TaxID=556327 RepID=A0ABP3FD84_9GAMM|nr:ATPase [Psychrobacter aestuarii]